MLAHTSQQWKIVGDDAVVMYDRGLNGESAALLLHKRHVIKLFFSS